MTVRTRSRNRVLIPALVACFYAGIAVGWLLRGMPAPRPSRVVDAPQEEVRLKPGPATHAASDVSSPVIAADSIAELRHRHLLLPIDRANLAAMEGQFGERRAGGVRGHEAVDILAERNTPVRAVEDGTIAKLFISDAGGITIYQFDPTERFCYYYAHLESYANGLHEKQRVSAGETIGYVGTTGNAPRNTPHLHFAITELTPARRWWEGRPIDPFLVLRK